MGKPTKSILMALILFFLAVSNISAELLVTESSSEVLTSSVSETSYSEIRLEAFLRSYNSPLSEQAGEFIYAANTYDLDWRMLPAITGVESTFGKRIPANSYNAYGWANGKYTFESWSDSIDHVSESLKVKYVDRGADSVYEIGRIYAPPSPTWAYKVEGFMNKIDPLPLDFSL